MMARQGQNFVIHAKWIKVGAAALAIASVLGPALGAGVAYVVRDANQEARISALEKSQEESLDRIEKRLGRIELLLMERR